MANTTLMHCACPPPHFFSLSHHLHLIFVTSASNGEETDRKTQLSDVTVVRQYSDVSRITRCKEVESSQTSALYLMCSSCRPLVLFVHLSVLSTITCMSVYLFCEVITGRLLLIALLTLLLACEPFLLLSPPLHLLVTSPLLLLVQRCSSPPTSWSLPSPPASPCYFTPPLPSSFLFRDLVLCSWACL
jgi:hypothetical protein